LYDQKPEEPAPVLPLMTENATSRSKSHTSRFEYVENAPSVGNHSEDNQMIGHAAPPKSSNFFSEFGMDSGYHKKPTSSSSKVQVMYVLFNNLSAGNPVTLVVLNSLN
jgi:ADP-ribosylation factor GTPase-activating protein 2/3